MKEKYQYKEPIYAAIVAKRPSTGSRAVIPILSYSEEEEGASIHKEGQGFDPEQWHLAVARLTRMQFENIVLEGCI